MSPAHSRLAKLHMTIRRAFRSTERHQRSVRTRRAYETNLLTSVATGNDLETAREELQRPVGGPPVSNQSAVHRGAGYEIGWSRGVGQRILRLVGSARVWWRLAG